MSEQLTSDTTVSVDEAPKIVNDSKRDLQLSDVHQIEKRCYRGNEGYRNKAF